jgi:hypothetical protein
MSELELIKCQDKLAEFIQNYIRIVKFDFSSDFSIFLDDNGTLYHKDLTIIAKNIADMQISKSRIYLLDKEGILREHPFQKPISINVKTFRVCNNTVCVIHLGGIIRIVQLGTLLTIGSSHIPKAIQVSAYVLANTYYILDSDGVVYDISGRILNLANTQIVGHYALDIDGYMYNIWRKERTHYADVAHMYWDYNNDCGLLLLHNDGIIRDRFGVPIPELYSLPNYIPSSDISVYPKSARNY